MARAESGVAASIEELAARLGIAGFVAVCTDLLAGAPRERHVEALRCLTGHEWLPGDAVLDPTCWRDFWVRSWGARGLLHVWDDSATEAVVAGLDDEHYRPAEMCLKVVARHDVAQAGDGAARLVSHELPRVRLQALRAIGLVGDTEHLAVVQSAFNDGVPVVRDQAARAWAQLESRLDL